MAADSFGFSWDDQDQQRKLQQQQGNPSGVQDFAQPAGNLVGDMQATSIDNPMATQPSASPTSFMPQTPQTDWGTLETGAPHGDAALDPGSFPQTPQTDWSTPSYAQPAPSSPPSTGAPSAPSATDTMAPYKDTVSKLQQTTDPTEKAMLQDQLARSVFSQLKTAGHDVKWDGDQLMIDGRPYVMAGSVTPTPGDLGTYGEPGGFTGGSGVQTARATPDSANWNTKGAAAPQYVASNPGGQAPSGWDQAKWTDPNNQDPKYVFGRMEMEDSGGDMMFQTPEERNKLVQDIMRAYPGATFDGKDAIDLHDGGAPIDIFIGADAGQYQGAFQPMTGATPAPAAALPTGMGAQGAAGVELGTPSYEQPAAQPAAQPSGVQATAQPAQPTGGGTDPFAASGGGQFINGGWYPNSMLQGQGQQGFQTTGPTYTPGQIGTSDIPNFSYDDLMTSLSDLGPNEGGTDSLVGDILAHPESIDAHTLDTMKAKSKDEIAEMGQIDDQNRTAQGYQLGISDSPWLASEQNAAHRGRQMGLVKSNRDLELSAAQTNMADKRAAATLGSSYLSAKSGRKTAATALAADTTLRAASVRGDRMALRESINQKAAELGQSADRIQLDYTMGLIEDATRRHGIDIGASIDRAKLAQAGREFQEDLAFRIAALSQADAQFGAQYGLDVEKQRHTEDQDAMDRYTTD